MSEGFDMVGGIDRGEWDALMEEVEEIVAHGASWAEFPARAARILERLREINRERIERETEWDEDA